MDQVLSDPPKSKADGTAKIAVELKKPRSHGAFWLGVGIRAFILLLIGGLILVVAYEWNWWVGSAALQTTDDAYLQADTTPLAAKVPGYVRAVHVQDFQRVHAGDPIVDIVDDDYRAQLGQAQANVDAAKAAIDNIEQQKRLQETVVTQAEADIHASEADVTRYHLEAVRQQTLLAKSYAGTPQLTEQAVDNEKRAEATLALNRAKLDQQRQQINVLDSQKAQAAAALEAQKAARNLADINLGYTRITAPVDGMVSERRVRPGQYLSVGTQVISLVPLPNVWVIANYRETQMTNIRPASAPGSPWMPFPARSCTGKSTVGRRHPARSLRCCRQTTRPATSPRWYSAFR
jgi:membrane fusion protein, multidrug efflux system